MHFMGRMSLVYLIFGCDVAVAALLLLLLLV